MSSDHPKYVISHSPGFRRRRGLNWTAIGFMYAAYYICRYSFKFATPGLKDEFGYTTTQLSDIWAIWSLAYGTGQFFNGLLSDRVGGKLCMQIGAIGTIILNFLFGFSSLPGMFSSFALIYLVNGYFQAFGAPGMVKINAAWFHRTERGTFSGIFGGMIQLGKAGIALLAPWVLSGMVVFGNSLIATGQWRWLFKIPPLFTIAAVIFLTLATKQTPDEAGFPGEIEDELDNSEGVTVKLSVAFKTIFTNPFVWFYAVAYASTGAVRHSYDQLSNLFFEEQLGVNMKSNLPLIITAAFFLEPWVSFLSSLASGFISDKFFGGRRAPVAVVLYLITTVVAALSAAALMAGFLEPGTAGVILGCVIMLAIAMSVNSTHSLVGAAAPMDIGGKKMAGFAAGVIDSFQYYGSALSLLITGRVIDATWEQHGWLAWYVIMAAFGFMGAIAIYSLILKQRRMRAAGLKVIG
jgi:OPA family glycerol-3-phosphate transporter-like MFS transporter